MNPSSRPIRDRPRNGGTLSRLYQWLDAAGVRYTSFVNCCHVPGRVSRSDVDLDLLRGCIAGRGYAVLALGGFASGALSAMGVEHLGLPHPSGLNRQLNDRAFVEETVLRLKDYISS